MQLTRRAVFVLGALLICAGQSWAVNPSTNNTCHNSGFSVISESCSLGTVSGGDVLIVGGIASGTITISGCGATWHQDTTVSSSTAAYGTSPTAGACSPQVAGTTSG